MLTRSALNAMLTVKNLNLKYNYNFTKRRYKLIMTYGDIVSNVFWQNYTEMASHGSDNLGRNVKW